MNLKAARQAAGFTQKAMADKLGISSREYQRVETGAVCGTIDLWDTLEDLFNVHQRVLREMRPDTGANQ